MPLTPGPLLPRTFYDRDVLDVARDLLGCVVIHASDEGEVGVRLTEVEAYAGESDPGSHAFRGRTPRTEVMFGEAGFAYVYFSYGMHWCMNVVTGAVGVASAVLLRGGEVVLGKDLACSRRPTARTDRDLARGPARLTSALGVNKALNASDLCGTGPLTLHAGPDVGAHIGAETAFGPRVGVGGLGSSTEWRLWLVGEPTVSAYKPHASKPARTQGSGT